MKQSVLLTFLVLSLLAFGSSAARAQMQPPAQAQGDTSLPDFSGFNLIDSFARLPEERTSLETLCDVRRASIDEVTGKIEDGKAKVDEVKVTEGDKTSTYKSVDKVPEKHQDQVKKLVEAASSNNLRFRFNQPRREEN